MISWLKLIISKNSVVQQEEIDYQSFLFLKKVFQNKKIKIKGTGLSMWPTIKEDQVIEVEVIPTKQIKKRIKKESIIAYYSIQEKRIIAHRVVSLRQKKHQLIFITKGDNVGGEDIIPVLPKYILGLAKI